MPKFEKEQAVNVLLEKPLEGLKTLETIQESPPVQPDQPLVTDSIGESVSVAKTEALSKIGEAVVEAQKLNTEKPEDIKNKTIDINGKSVDVQVTQQTVTVKTGDEKVTIDKTRYGCSGKGRRSRIIFRCYAGIRLKIFSITPSTYHKRADYPKAHNDFFFGILSLQNDDVKGR